MPLFSRKDRPNHADTERSPGRNRITVCCPECGFDQNEPRMVVSTYCRGCSAHYQINEGKAVPKKTRPSNPFTALKNAGTSPKLRNNAPDGSPAPKENPHSAPATAAITNPSTTTPPATQNNSGTLGNLPASGPKPREVVCFDCKRVHQAPAEASSTLCPACGSYIALKNYEIRENWNRTILTRGNVTIHKKATVTGITIRSHHLTVLGKLTGGVDCSGDFIIQSHGKIMGKVRCKRLIVEKRAQVEFSNPVQCEDAIIDGEVTGHFTCSGKLHLKKKATLNGNIKVGTMAVDEGARHHGQISIGQ